MKCEIEIPDSELSEAIRKGGMAALNSAKMKTLIVLLQEEKIEAIIRNMDVNALVRMEIDTVMKHVIRDGVQGRIRAIVRPIIEQEIAKLKGETAVSVATKEGEPSK